MAVQLSDLELGGLVGDASAMGLHWLYDQKRIAELAGETPEFRNPNEGDYTKGYFAHGGKAAGELSQYGWQMLAMSSSIAKAEGFDRGVYADEFNRIFGFGGCYTGYIDRPTRGTLVNRENAGEDEVPMGADDAQLPAVSKLPPLVEHCREEDDFLDIVEEAVRVTNDNDDAVEWARFAAAMLAYMAENDGREDAVRTGLEQLTSDEKRNLIESAIESAGDDSLATIDGFGMACQLIQSMPNIVHLFLTHDDPADGLRANILGGGDSCGRGVVLGALYATEYDMPSDWLAKLRIPNAL